MERTAESRTAGITTAPNTAILRFKVFGERNGSHLDRQALVKLVNLDSQTAVWQPTQDNSEGLFANIPYGRYDAEISAVGYLSSHQEFRLPSANGVLEFEVVLHRDPNAVNLDVADAVMSSQARKETKKAILALKSAKLNDAQKHLDAAYKESPADPKLNFLLGYLYFQKKDFPQAATYLHASTDRDPNNAQALSLLGRASLENKNYPAAQTALEQAVRANSDDWLAHNLLATVYLRQKDYEKARSEAEIAIAKGKASANSAQVVLGEALVNLGRDQEGVDALKAFLQQSPREPIAKDVRNFVAQVVDLNTQPGDHSPQPIEKILGVDPLAAVPAAPLTIKKWQPPGVDELKLSVATGVDCPSAQVIAGSGERVQELVDNVARFAAVEDLFHQALDEYGAPLRTETRKYDYVASIAELRPGFLSVDEYRTDKIQLSDFPDNIASNGFAALALVFHPHMRDNFTLLCEGLGDWHGQPSWLVHFQQRQDRPNRMHSYKVGGQIHAVDLRGRAWITPDNFQIVRIEAEMINPMPEIQLLSEHQVVEYGAIPFPKKGTSLWLPKTAEIYFDFRKHRYYRRHSFDHYMLFSVDSDEKRKEPVAKRDTKSSGDETQLP